MNGSIRHVLLLFLLSGPGCWEETPEITSSSAGDTESTGTDGTDGTGGTTEDSGSTSSGSSDSSATESGSSTSGSTGPGTDSGQATGSTTAATDTGNGCTVLTFGENDDDDIKGVTADTWVDEEFPDDANGLDDDLRADGVSADGLNENLMVRFNVSTLPAGTVTEATFNLSTNEHEDANSSVGSQFFLYAINEAWVENEVDWVHASASVPWSAAGCSASPCIGAELLFFEPTEGNHTYPLALAGAMVESWRDDPDTNFGLLLATDASNGAHFHSSESANTTMRPFLVVEVCP
jgi:hypothetical protein